MVRCWFCHQTGHGAYNCKMQGRDSGKTAGTEIRKSAGDKVTVQDPVRTQKPVLSDHVSAPKANAGQTGQTQVNVSHVNIQNYECNMEHRHDLCWQFQFRRCVYRLRKAWLKLMRCVAKCRKKI